MINSILLAKANLKKGKGNAISLCIVMLLVAMFINIGFVMLFGISSFFDQRAEELNTGHIVTLLSEDYYFRNSQLQFIEADSRVETIEIQSFVAWDGSAILNDMTDMGFLMFSPVYQDQVLNPLTLVGEYLPLTGNAVYVPHYMVMHGNLSLGDIILFDFMSTEIELTVAGSIDEILFGSINGFRRRLYVSDEMFASLQLEFPEEKSEIAIIRLNDVSYTSRFHADYVEHLITLTPTQDSILIIAWVQHFLTARGNHTMMPTVLGSILAVFAIMFLIVSLVVIRFRISNSINEGMINIGTQKALGYSNRQIIDSILMQFGFISGIGGTIGLILGHFSLPLVIGVMGATFSLQWQPSINIVAMLIMLALIIASVLLFSLLSTRRIYKLYPLVALRGGFVTHNFKRSALPLDKTCGPLSFLLATKDILQNKRQAIAVGIIVMAITFIAATGLGTNYIVNINSEEFLNTMVGEPFDIAPMVRSANYAHLLTESLATNPQVERFTGFHNNVRYSLEGVIIVADIVEDHSILHGQTLVNGRFPIHDNEIALGRVVMRYLNKNIGDWISINSGGQEFSFLITGQIQSTDNAGFVASIPVEGVRRMHEYEIQAFMVFLHEGVCSTLFAENLREVHGDIFMNMLVFDEIAENFIESMGGLFASVAASLLIVVAVIVIATMYLVIKTTILHKRRELGIQKALGFTTWQLMNQIALNLTPAITIGSIAGATLAFQVFDQFFAIILGMGGDISVSIPISLAMTVLASLGIIVLAYVVSMMVALRIRKISAYALVSE